MVKTRFYDRWFLQFQGFKHRPQTVMPHIGHGASSKVIPAPENHIGVLGMIRTVGFRPQPQVPVKSPGNSRSIGRKGGILRPYRTDRPVMYFLQLTDGLAV